MIPSEMIQIDTASVVGNNGITYLFQVVINQQDTPAISIDGLRELRRQCDLMISLGEDNEKSKEKSKEKSDNLHTNSL